MVRVYDVLSGEQYYEEYNFSDSIWKIYKGFSSLGEEDYNDIIEKNFLSILKNKELHNLQ